MNFEQLRSLVKNIKAQMLCPSCGMNFENEDIHILNSIENASVFTVQCHNCDASLFVTATLNSSKEEPVGEIVDFENTPSLEPVAADDVLSIHEFLKDFSGDFTKEFSQN